ncbi:hypothetical protein EYZ11_000325 [Aspergillus tanneri]|uniref:Fe2OG dioxygenase domain-containing protein n=1 Tax=Aspergillus tanneri TaxID=1220188 RepID=A0A4S3JXN3_9EURO|nr:uncharacterized protein ATNIH1004_004320 [Aspergillus tanneri]KAA8648435.1 hypothetical protein ATNIH1004_004320 [Aspergillus tanneri]THD00134.1 hypothetical protein EYZ11_000325 [Aspergillus tanneri]
MSTTFSSLPIVDLSPLQTKSSLGAQSLHDLSHRLYHVFATTGFAYLVNSPLSFTPDEVFSMAREFFSLPTETKMSIAKRSFNKDNSNTYRGYFPTQPDVATDNLKEGLEIGPPHLLNVVPGPDVKINLAEPNIWPDAGSFTGRSSLEQLYSELQSLSSRLLSLLAVSLGKSEDYFTDYLVASLSTLRLLHYPIPPSVNDDDGDGTQPETHSTVADPQKEPNQSSKLDSVLGCSSQSISDVKLSCTPHTDSGILTLLHQDSTGGLEVRDSSGRWVPAPYIPDSIVVNIGDLMAKVSGGRFVATMHRVRRPEATSKNEGGGIGRFSVPFFFEPGEKCIVRDVDGKEDAVVYGDHVREKMKTWVEFKGL